MVLVSAEERGGGGAALNNRWILLLPLLVVFTPSPRRAIQSILFALQAPVRYGPVEAAPLDVPSDALLSRDPRRNAVGGGDVVRDCAVGR